MNNITKRFFSLKNSGVDLEQALDIGAYRNDFTNILKSVWPNIRVQQFEADERQKQYLQEDAQIVLLGDSERTVDFYTIEDQGWGTTTGSSIFRENTVHYQDPNIVSKQMTTLDKVVDMSGDWNKGLVKIDAQGSELLILEGAKQFLKLNPKYILLECSIVEYNQGAPLVADVMSYMSNINYKMVDIFDVNYMNDQLIQMDILFTR